MGLKGSRERRSLMGGCMGQLKRLGAEGHVRRRKGQGNSWGQCFLQGKPQMGVNRRHDVWFASYVCKVSQAYWITRGKMASKC